MCEPHPEPEFAFGVEIKRPPEHAIDDDDEQAHHRDAEHDAMEIAGVGLLRNIGAEPVRLQVLDRPRTRPRRRCWHSTSRRTR